jgi:predicted  nucleic acid-binding Zn-ribbon protein
LKVKESWDIARRELAQVVADLQRLSADQDRIRKNLRETPKEAEVYATYLKKLSDQEKEIDALTAKQKSLMTDEFTTRKKYDDFLANISD